MTAECAAIVVIILLTAGVMAHEGRTGLAVAVLPLVLTPMFYLLSSYVANFINRWQEPDIYLIARAAVVVVGSLLASLIMGTLSARLKSKVVRRVYLVLCGGFDWILTIIILFRILPF